MKSGVGEEGVFTTQRCGEGVSASLPRRGGSRRCDVGGVTVSARRKNGCDG